MCQWISYPSQLISVFIEGETISDLNENPYEPPATTELVTDLNEWPKSKRAIIYLYAAVAVFGIAEVFAAEYGFVNVFLSLVIALLATNWLAIDCRRREIRLVPIVRLLYFISWPVASLIYLVSTRGVTGFGWWALNFVGLIGTLMIVFIPAVIIATGMGWDMIQ